MPYLTSISTEISLKNDIVYYTYVKANNIHETDQAKSRKHIQHKQRLVLKNQEIFLKIN